MDTGQCAEIEFWGKREIPIHFFRPLIASVGGSARTGSSSMRPPATSAKALHQETIQDLCAITSKMARRQRP